MKYMSQLKFFTRIKHTLILLFITSLFLVFSNASYAEKSNMYKRLHNPEMEYQMGLMYYRGKGRINGADVKKDYTKAQEHFRKADRYGSVEAKLILGLMHYNAEGVEKDNKQAFEWVKKAAILNNTDAQILLAQMYRNGEGVVRDNKKAIEFLSKAANAGDDTAQYDLGNMYFSGAIEGSSERKNQQILFANSNTESGKVEIKILFTHSKVTSDVVQAEEWFRKAALKGNADANYTLGTIYYQGIAGAIEKDKVKAADWLRESIGSGNTDAQVLLGIMHYNGEGVTEDKNQALSLFHMADKKGDTNAKFILKFLGELNKKMLHSMGGQWGRSPMSAGQSEESANQNVASASSLSIESLLPAAGSAYSIR